MEKSLSLTWAEISKNHNFGISRDNDFKFYVHISRANVYRHDNFCPDPIWIIFGKSTQSDIVHMCTKFHENIRKTHLAMRREKP